MKRLERWIIRNWAGLTVGLVTTAIAAKTTYYQRGYAAVGSEWFILPFTVFVFAEVKRFMRYGLPDLIDLFRQAAEEDEEDDEYWR